MRPEITFWRLNASIFGVSVRPGMALWSIEEVSHIGGPSLSIEEPWLRNQPGRLRDVTLLSFYHVCPLLVAFVVGSYNR